QAEDGIRVFHLTGVQTCALPILNLPTLISFANGSGIEYFYNAAGQKVKKTVHDMQNNTQKVVDYLDGFQYAGGILQFFPTAEGYVKATQINESPTNPDYAFNYVFNYTDHLGNVRLSFSKDPVNHQLKIMEENHYYPFGLKHSVYAGGLKDYKEDPVAPGTTILTNVTETEYMYKYNGKEFQDELGLGLYDYGARLYDHALGRWSVVDPLADLYYSHSPYNYTLNNPVFFIDPNGMNVDWYQSEGGDYVYDESITSQQDLTDAGIEGTYLGESYSFNVSDNSNGNQLGTVNLNEDGSASFTSTDGGIVEFSDMTIDMGFDSGNKIMAGNYQNGDMFDKGNFIAGAAATGLENTRGSFRFGTTTQGFSPKYYANSWGGNQYAKTF